MLASQGDGTNTSSSDRAEPPITTPLWVALYINNLLTGIIHSTMKKGSPLTFKQKLWISLEPIMLILLKDIIIFAVIFATLVVVFAGVAGMKALGLRPQRAEFFETLHFYTNAAVATALCIDFFFKTILELFARKS